MLSLFLPLLFQGLYTKASHCPIPAHAALFPLTPLSSCSSSRSFFPRFEKSRYLSTFQRFVLLLSVFGIMWHPFLPSFSLFPVLPFLIILPLFSFHCSRLAIIKSPYPNIGEICERLGRTISQSVADIRVSLIVAHALNADNRKSQQPLS